MTRARPLLVALAGTVALLAAVAAVLLARFDADHYKSAAAAYLQTHYQRTLVIKGPVSLRLLPRLEVALEDVSLSEPGQPQQPFAQLASARLAVQWWPLLHRQLVVDRVEATGVQLRYRRDADGHRNFDDLLTRAPAGTSGATPVGDAAPPMQLDVSAIELERLLLDVDDRQLPLRGRLALAQLSSGRLRPGIAAPVKLSARVDLTQPAVTAQLDGALALQLDLGDAGRALRVEARQADLRWQAELPGRPPLTAQLKGSFGYTVGSSAPVAPATARQLHWQLDGTLNQQALHTTGQLTLDGPRPVAQADLRCGELDLAALLGPRPTPAASSAAAPSPGRNPPAADRPIDLAGLHQLDGRVHLQADTLRFAPYRLHRVDAVGVLKDGTLQVQPLTFDLWDGHVTGQLRASAAGAQTVALAAQAQHLDIAQALQDVAHSDLLEGHGDVALDLRSSGRSLHALKAALAGDAHLQLRDGAVRGINLAQSPRPFQAALSGGQADVFSAAQPAEKTDFSELSASLRFSQGVGRNDDLVVKSPFLRLGGEGSMNLPAGTLDYTLHTTVANTAKGQGGAELAALHGVTVPVRLQGPWGALRWQVRWSEVATGTVRNTLKQQLGDRLREELRGQVGAPAGSDAASQPSDAALREKAREKLKEQLKGWLR